MNGLLEQLKEIPFIGGLLAPNVATKPNGNGLLAAQPSDSVDPNSNIDFNFIKELEGFELKGYVPEDKDGVLGKSGVTIASGFDVGQRNEQDLVGLPEDIQIALKPYLGLKKEAAVKKLEKDPLTLTNDQAQIVNEFAKKTTMNKLKKQWKEKTGTDFELLPKNKATPIASVAFQYGNLETKTPNFWEQVTTNSWDDAKKNLADFGDDYKTRRKEELDYFIQNKYSPNLYGEDPSIPTITIRGGGAK